LINKIENVQSEAARIVTGGTKLTSIQKLYEKTGWEKLLERREKHQLILLYKIVNNQTPGYLRNVLPDRVDNRHYHNTRQSANILEISSKTKFYSDYFLPSSIKLWNRLPIDTRNSRFLNIFKERIKTQNSKSPAHYYSQWRSLGLFSSETIRRA
jgi:tRNA A37 N6-isopentenylltransferase MiaA